MKKDMMGVAVSRGLSLAAGVVTGLLLPKLLTVSDYGYLKIFTLYLTYTALLHFGFVDGILLKFAGRDYEMLCREQLRTYTCFFALFQVVVGCALSAAGLLFHDPAYRFVLQMLGVNMVLVNLTTYYQFISQATQRFSEYSAKQLLAAVLKAGLVIALLVLQSSGVLEASYRLYIIALNGIDGVMLLWYVWIYRDITFGPGLPLKELHGEIRELFKQGILLTLAYQVSHLVLVLDRQFVSVLYPTDTYAVYSFAYNLVMMLSVMISSLAVVLLPVLKRVELERIKPYYRKTLSVTAVLTGAALCCYFPLVELIRWFLPEYESSLSYLAAVLPALTYSSCISVVMFTFCKALAQNANFFKTGCVVMGIGCATNAAAYGVFRTPLAISYASLLTMAVWFLLQEGQLYKHTGMKGRKEFFYLTVLTLGFLSVAQAVSSCWVGLAAYLVWFLAATWCFYRKDAVRS